MPAQAGPKKALEPVAPVKVHVPANELSSAALGSFDQDFVRLAGGPGALTVRRRGGLSPALLQVLRDVRQ
eukprot:386962-Lingulodinium_polyedra.AAC.1